MARKPLATPPLPWLDPGQAFAPVHTAWGSDTPMPGLLAAGGDLSVATLVAAYGQGIFPWFSSGQPVLWWSPAPRMVLQTAQFRLHRSLRKTVARFAASASCQVRVDCAFGAVIRACAASPRRGQDGTWIVPPMVAAYEALHAAGHAHSVETWVDGELVAGLYCVNLGHALFGESMFTRRTDASKIALAALVAFARQHGLPLIDCQQNTAHLASLGAAPMPRVDFVARIAALREKPAPLWGFEPGYWQNILKSF